MRLRKKNVSRVASVALAAAMTVSMAAPAAFAADCAHNNGSIPNPHQNGYHDVVCLECGASIVENEACTDNDNDGKCDVCNYDMPAQQRSLTINYMVNGETVKSETVQVDSDAESYTVTAPDGYELMPNDNGIYPITGLNEISVDVKESTRSLTINYVANGETVKSETIDIAKSAEKINVTAPDGYTLMPNDDGVYTVTGLNEIFVDVKENTRPLTINYVVNGETVKSETIDIAKSAEKINVTAPDGYALMPSDDGVYIVTGLNEIFVDVTENVRPLKVNYVVNGETILSETISVSKSAEKINVTAPDGYTLMPSDDGIYIITDLNEIFVDVKAATKTIKVHYVNTIGDGEEVAVVEVTVAANAKTFTAVAPEGYELATEDAEYPVMDNVYVSVTKKATKPNPAEPDKPATKPGNGTTDSAFGVGYHPVCEFFNAVRNFFKNLFRR